MSSSDTIQVDVDKVMVSHLGIDIESIDVVRVFLDSTCLLPITDLVETSVRLTVVNIVFPNSILDFLPCGIPVSTSFEPFQ